MNNIDLDFEQSVFAGIDEVGRGCLAGPIVAACVIIDYNSLGDFDLVPVRDSKKISFQKRQELASLIKDKFEHKILSFEAHEIDRIGIQKANMGLFTQLIDWSKPKSQMILCDGYAPCQKEYIQAVVKGDQKSKTIAAASIIAKDYRDNLMIEADQKYPGYDFINNKGYGTAKHQEGLKRLGGCELHRNSFSWGI